MNKNNQGVLADEVAAWQQTESGILSNCLIIGDAYVDLEGNIVDSSDKVIGKLIQVEDENGNLVDTIVDANNNPLHIGENTADVIQKLKDTQQEIKNTDGKKAKVTVEYETNYIQKYNNQGPGPTMYATGTENAMPGIASVAEYGEELIFGAGGRIALATGRQYMNFEGGENVYNARQTKEILNSISKPYQKNNNSSEKEIINSFNMLKNEMKELKYIVSNIKLPENVNAYVELNGEKVGKGTTPFIEKEQGQRMNLCKRGMILSDY